VLKNPSAEISWINGMHGMWNLRSPNNHRCKSCCICMWRG